MHGADKLLTLPSVRCVWIYLFLLPFQLVSQFGWYTIPGVGVAAFFYIGFLAAGEEIEQPFGYDEVRVSPLTSLRIAVDRNSHRNFERTLRTTWIWIYSAAPSCTQISRRCCARRARTRICPLAARTSTIIVLTGATLGSREPQLPLVLTSTTRCKRTFGMFLEVYPDCMHCALFFPDLLKLHRLTAYPLSPLSLLSLSKFRFYPYLNVIITAFHPSCSRSP